MPDPKFRPDQTPEQFAKWNEWLSSRPPSVRPRVDQYPPGHAYRLHPTGQKVWICAYSEYPDGVCDHCQVLTSALGTLGAEIDPDGTGPMIVVFGVPFTDLEPWVD